MTASPSGATSSRCSSGLCCLLEPSQVRSCLEHARDHWRRAAGSRLPRRRSAARRAATGGDDDSEPLVAIEHDGRISRLRGEPRGTRAAAARHRYRLVPEDGRRIAEQTIRQRYLLDDELEALVSDAPGSGGRAGGGFRRAAGRRGRHLVLVAERKRYAGLVGYSAGPPRQQHGPVWRAHDARLGRAVALVLPPAVGGSQRIKRFEGSPGRRGGHPAS